MKATISRTTFMARGWVLGNLWGGGTGGYMAKTLYGDTFEEIKKQAEEGIKDGSLDSGMGYESLIGAKLRVVKTEIAEINGKEFSHDTVLRPLYIGNLTYKQKMFLARIK